MNRHIALICLVLLLWPSLSPSETDAGAGFQTRAVWVTRWAFKKPEDVRTLFADLEAIGVNTVFFQVRGACDALYRSSLEPWSGLLTGHLGDDPGWDPLAIALEEGHGRAMEVHAWINVFTGWAVSDSGEGPPRSDPPHVLHSHPEWLACDAAGHKMPLARSKAKHNYVFLSPTHEDVQDYIAAVVRDLVSTYEIDGLHLDYVRFPDSTYSYDTDTKAAYRLDVILKDVGHEILSFGEWRTRRLTNFVGRLARAVRTARPDVEISAAVWQKIGDSRDIYFQDGVEWMERGHLDFLVPMIYTTGVKEFGERLGTYTEPAGAGNVVAGLGPYLETFTDSILVAELEAARSRGVRGYSIFNSDFALTYAEILKGYAPN